MSRNPDREITGKRAGNMVKHIIEDVEQKMADGVQVSAGPVSEADAKALQKAREENRKSGSR